MLWEPVAGHGIRVKLPLSVGRSFFYWEYFVVFQKAIVIFFLMFIHRYQLQGILIFFLVLAFILIQLNNEPYYTRRLQGLHIAGLLLCLVYVLCKLVTAGLSTYSGEISQSTIESVTNK